MDFLSNELSEDDMPAIEGIYAFAHGLISYENSASKIIEFAQRFPKSIIANVYSGFLWMFLESPDANINATKYLKICEDVLNNDSRKLFPRGDRHVNILSAWISDDIPLTLQLIEESIDIDNRDLVLVKLFQYLSFNMGNLTEMLRIVKKVLPFCSDIGYCHGMIAFAYEQCHQLEEAEKAARHALSITTKEPWAEHALAHVMLTQGRVAEGLKFLENASVNWQGLNSFMSTHLWWHLALFHICLLNFSRALEIYDLHVWAVAKDYSQDQINAISLLVRLELAGCQDVGMERWNDLANYLSVRSTDTVQPFHSLHYLLGLVRANRKKESEELLQAIINRSNSAPSFIKSAWKDAAVPAAIGIIAWNTLSNDDSKANITACKNLAQALDYMQSVGGSNAQRDLFEQIYLDSLIKSHDHETALRIIESRSRHDPENLALSHLKNIVMNRLIASSSSSSSSLK